jgi:hypothetical protein
MTPLHFDYDIYGFPLGELATFLPCSLMLLMIWPLCRGYFKG